MKTQKTERKRQKDFFKKLRRERAKAEARKHGGYTSAYWDSHKKATSDRVDRQEYEAKRMALLRRKKNLALQKEFSKRVKLGSMKDSFYPEVNNTIKE